MKTRVLSFLAWLTVCVSPLTAQDEAAPVVISAVPPLPFTLLILVAAAVCAVFCFQVFMVVKGGQLSKSWLVFAGAFVVLGLSQLAVLLTGFGVLNMNRFIVPAMLVAMTGLFAYGLYETKRVLS
ncbi:MAG: hypothetical protein AB1644_02575 [Candidatus Zixiibacteriota bacterium]